MQFLYSALALGFSEREREKERERERERESPGDVFFQKVVCKNLHENTWALFD